MDPLTPNIVALMYFGDAIFAMSGALAAGRHRMDIMGFILIGTITGIGGGTLRDLLLGRTVWWTENPVELLLCVGVSVVTFFAVSQEVARRAWVNWSDALGLSGAGSIVSQVRSDLGLDTLSVEGGPSSSRIVAGKRFGERLFVEYGYGLIDQLGELLLRYQLNDRLVLESRTGTVSNLDILYSVRKR